MTSRSVRRSKRATTAAGLLDEVRKVPSTRRPEVGVYWTPPAGLLSPPRRDDYATVEAYVEAFHLWRAVNRDSHPTDAELQTLENVLIECVLRFNEDQR